MREISSTTRCVRHPNAPTALRCGRCDDFICPRCMVHSPVGARCPSCASIGRPSSLLVTPLDFAKAIVTALVYGVAVGVAVGYVIWGIFSFGVSSGFILTIISAGSIFLSGIPAGEIVRRVSGNKIDNRIRYIAAFSVLIVFLASGFTTSQLLGFTVLGSLIPIAGLVLGVIVAMRRAR